MEIYLTILSSLLTLLLAVVGFWLIRFVKSVDALTATVASMQLDQRGNSTACMEKHSVINARFKIEEEAVKELNDLINEHNGRILVIESQIKK